MASPGSALRIRQASEGDVAGIHEIFSAVYGDAYPYRDFYDDDWLKRAIFSDNVLTVIAEDRGSGRLLGTASVVSDIGAQSDLLGEFGRLAVLPSAKGGGIGKLLMAKRVELSEQRLHAAIVENRTVHAFSQRICETFGFSPVGLLPAKHRFMERESTALYARHFGAALELRRNHPRIVPELHELASAALCGCKLTFDAIVDEEAPAYVCEHDYDVEQLSADGYPMLLRIERGRVRHREVFGAMSLNHGFFKLQAKQANYLVVRQRSGFGAPASIAGAIGFTISDHEKAVRVFELVAVNDDAIPRLLDALLERCDTQWLIEYVEVDVSAFAPRMQRSLIERGFIPAAFVPAMVFQDTERLDIVRMSRIAGNARVAGLHLTDVACQAVQPVLSALRQRAVQPELASAVDQLELFRGLSSEQRGRLSAACTVVSFEPAHDLMRVGEIADAMYILLSGSVSIQRGEAARKVGVVGAGETVGEHSLLIDQPRSATVVADEPVVAARLSRQALSELTRRRPDIAVILYRNLGIGLGRKLRRLSDAPPNLG